MNPNYSYPNTYSYPAMNTNVPNPGYNQAPPPGMGVQQNNPPRTEFPSQNYNPYQQPFYPHTTNQNAPHSAQNNVPPPTAQNPPQIPQNHQQPSGNILNGPNAVPLNQRVIPPPKYYKSNKGKPISTLSDALNKHAAEFSRFFQFIVNQAKICDQEDEREKQARKAEDGKEKPAEDGKEKQTEEGEKQPEPAKED
ncbi:hypothetical protein niasHT_014948 [Heterodera trifolii]|uniref:Uncharacterized protein n=1 Tax=Heterodera trifolii TaxID=157864 RepID=A0ABD2LFP1_9BILA